MKKFLRMLFGPIQGLQSGRTSPNGPDSPLTIEDGSENATRRQLVQVLLRDVLRRSGIPAHWIDCQMMLVSSRTRGPGMYVRLVIKHWDEQLMTYAFAFQSELMRDIERFEPLAASWLHGISWQLDVADTCPHLRLPDKSLWQDADKSPLKMQLQPAAVVAAESMAETPAAVETASAPGQPVTSVKPLPAFDVTQPFNENSPADDLERLFAIRDRELAMAAGEGLVPVGYEKTQPAPL